MFKNCTFTAWAKEGDKVVLKGWGGKKEFLLKKGVKKGDVFTLENVGPGLGLMTNCDYVLSGYVGKWGLCVEKECGSCKFYARNDGTCRYNPPIDHYKWPYVNYYNYCHKFKERKDGYG